MINILSWIGSVGSIISNILVANKKLLGAQTWCFATGMLLFVALYKKEWSQVFLFGFYSLINIYMWYKWAKDEKNSKKRNLR